MAITWRLINETSGKVVVARLEIADGFWSRFVGLQFRRVFPQDAGLLLIPCNSVHTCLLRFPIDAVFLSNHGVVLAVRHHLKPWRMVIGPRKTHATLELAADTATLQVGDVLRIESTREGASTPKSVAFLQR